MLGRKVEDIPLKSDDTTPSKKCSSKTHRGQTQFSEPISASRQSSTIRRNLSILLAEDNPTNQIITRNLLQKEGHDVTIARNGHEAIGACHAQIFDVILMDIEMPNMNGIEATQYIRRHLGPNQTSLIIALTAYGSASQKYTYQHSGIDDVITKPFTLEAFAPVLTLEPVNIAKKDTLRTPAEKVKLSVIDPLILSRLARDHATKDIHYILRSFWRVADGLYEDMHSALENNDQETFDSCAHALKGAAANIGLNEIAYYSDNIARAPRDKVMTALAQIKHSMQRARTALDVFLKALD